MWPYLLVIYCHTIASLRYITALPHVFVSNVYAMGILRAQYLVVPAHSALEGAGPLMWWVCWWARWPVYDSPLWGANNEYWHHMWLYLLAMLFTLLDCMRHCMTTLFFCWPVASGSRPSPHGWDRGPDVMGLLACTFYTVNLVPTMNIGIRFAVVYTPLLLHICITLCCGINIHPKIRKKTLMSGWSRPLSKGLGTAELSILAFLPLHGPFGQ